MAYKFQHGQAILSGALEQEGSIDIKNDGSGEFELKHDGNTILNSSRALGNVTSISGSTSISGRDLVLDVGGKVGISTDTDLVTLTANKVSVAGVHSASARIDGFGLRIDTGGTIGTAGDNDLLTLNNNSLVVAGAGTKYGLFSGGIDTKEGATLGYDVAGDTKFFEPNILGQTTTVGVTPYAEATFKPMDKGDNFDAKLGVTVTTPVVSGDVFVTDEGKIYGGISKSFKSGGLLDKKRG